MCVDEFPELIAKKKTPMSPRSPWRRLREPLKPRLSRKVVCGARVNLNKYWSKFEVLKSPFDTFLGRNHDNEINDNLINEERELLK